MLGIWIATGLSERKLHSLKRAFTLTEVLIVVGIVVLLAGLLTPAVRQARLRAYMTTDLVHLHEIGLAAEMYASDNDKKFGWRAATLVESGYAKDSIVRSPIDPTSNGIGNVWLSSFTRHLGYLPTTYKLSYVSIGDGHEDFVIEELQNYPNFGWAACLANGLYNPSPKEYNFAGDYLRLMPDTRVIWRNEPPRDEYGSLNPFTDRRDLREWPWPK